MIPGVGSDVERFRDDHDHKLTTKRLIGIQLLPKSCFRENVVVERANCGPDVLLGANHAMP